MTGAFKKSKIMYSCKDNIIAQLRETVDAKTSTVLPGAISQGVKTYRPALKYNSNVCGNADHKFCNSSALSEQWSYDLIGA